MKLLLITSVILISAYSVADQSGMFNGNYNGSCWGFYTILSNLLVIIYLLAALINELSGILPLAENAVVSFTVMMSIILTGLVFHFLLMPNLIKSWNEGKSSWDPWRFSNFGVHYITPLAMFLYFFIFIDRSGMRVWDGLWWMLIPLAYVFYAVYRANHGYRFNDGGRWPYWFMDFDALGIPKVMRNLVILEAGFGLLGLLVAAISIKLR